ncbi:MAG TPA: DUF202 domain-containing protein [Candidatus Saccharimonadales bacterium]|nr:DUF202 domain-containing protein [Candidatus Saccharimonadales bacterium]
MSKTYYERFSNEELILRDHLAVDRTSLANEKTFLAYIRTSLTMLISAVTLIKLFDSVITQAIGWIFIVVGIILSILGGIRYIKLRQNIKKVKKTY